LGADFSVSGVEKWRTLDSLGAAFAAPSTLIAAVEESAAHQNHLFWSVL
jgi:hypothetical protein